MKKATTVIIPFFLIYSFVSAQQKTDTSLFEGYIDYKASYHSNVKGVSDNEIRERFGDSIRIYYKEGNIKWIYRDNLGYLKSYSTIKEKEHTAYDWSSMYPDTLFLDDLTEKKITVDTFYENGADSVLFLPTRIVIINGYIHPSNRTDSFALNLKYFFCPTLKIKPEWYVNYTEMKWNEITSQYKSIAIKMETDYGGLYTASFTAVKIKREKVDLGIFDLDKSKFFKLPE